MQIDNIRVSRKLWGAFIVLMLAMLAISGFQQNRANTSMSAAMDNSANKAAEHGFANGVKPVPGATVQQIWSPSPQRPTGARRLGKEKSVAEERSKKDRRSGARRIEDQRERDESRPEETRRDSSRLAHTAPRMRRCSRHGA